jgi:hypothetical protein
MAALMASFDAGQIARMRERFMAGDDDVEQLPMVWHCFISWCRAEGRSELDDGALRDYMALSYEDSRLVTERFWDVDSARALKLVLNEGLTDA